MFSIPRKLTACFCICKKILIELERTYSENFQQAYTSKESDSANKSYEFESQAKRLFEIESHSDSLTTISGLVLLYEFIGTHGQMATKYIKHMFNMATRMKLFGVEERLNINEYAALSPVEQRSTASVAWGAFNFFTYVCAMVGTNKLLTCVSMISLFDVAVATPYPPTIPILGSRESLDIQGNTTNSTGSAGCLMDQAFPFLCSFWTIVSGVMFVYRTSTGREKVPIAFALSKYYELLSLADNLPDSMIVRPGNPSTTLLFQ